MGPEKTAMSERERKRDVFIACEYNFKSLLLLCTTRFVIRTLKFKQFIFKDYH